MVQNIDFWENAKWYILSGKMQQHIEHWQTLTPFDFNFDLSCTFEIEIKIENENQYWKLKMEIVN